MHITITRKQFVVFLFLLVLVISTDVFLSGCSSMFRYRKWSSGYYDGMPCNQVGSTWRTEDGRIEFTIVNTDIRDREVTRGNGITYIEKGYNWQHGEGTYLAADGQSISIVYQEGGPSEEYHIYIGPDEHLENDPELKEVISEYWSVSKVCEDHIEFIVDRSEIYEPGDTICLYRVEPEQNTD